MREIKFRAWNKNTNKMVDLYKITPLAIDRDLNLDGLFLPFSKDYVLMQFTGLKDKNGKEIYEGDIIRHSYRVANTVIEWREKEAQWSMGGYNNDTIEVIGNIYENPELLKS